MSAWQILKIEKPWVGGSVAIALVALAVWRPWSRSASSHDGRWYYDLTTGDLVVASLKELPPAKLASGHEAVLAHVFTCGDCANRDLQFIGYLERYSEHGKQNAAKRLRSKQSDIPLDPMAEIEVAAAPLEGEAPKWVPMLSPAAVSIRDVGARCPGGRVVSCFPD